MNTKLETRNLKSKTNQKTSNSKRFDLEDRALQFAKDVRIFVSNLPKSISNIEDSKQLIRSSGSVGTNYLEANESLSKKDFIMRIKISKKEARETIWWLELIDADELSAIECERLQREATEIMNILGSILKKVEAKK